jgi:radical SAM superfamily enzyme YgiQ (UPF0313 family)
MGLERVTLITPPPLHSLLYCDLKFQGVDSVTPPLNLLSLAAYIRQFGFVPSIVDGYANSYNITEPDIVGITCTTPLFRSMVEVAQAIKNRFPEMRIIVGGPHITALTEDTLKYNCFDLAVIAEGELTLLHLLEALRDGEPLDQVRGIAYRENGHVVTNAPREKIVDLDILPPPAWDLLPSLGPPYQTSIVGTKKNKSTPIITSRGCPGRCIFCDTSTFGRKYRFFSTRYVLRMIEYLLEEHQIDDFLIYDDTFCANKKRVMEICEGILARGWKITWQCCARIEQVDYELLKMMKKAGCWEIEYGIESGDPRILKLMCKGVNLEKARDVIKMTHDVGIKARGNFIFGNLGETRESLERTIQFILSTHLDYVQQTFLTPYPGSAVYKLAHKYGEFDYDFTKMSNLTINFIPHGLTREELQHFSRKLFLKFYLRSRIILSVLRSINSLEAFQRILASVKVFLRHVLSFRVSQS